MFQGLGKEGIALNKQWGFDPAEIDIVILSHAHIDHIGLLPKLIKDGFNGPVWCTTPTAELAMILLRDSAHIQEADTRFVNARRKEQGKEPVEPLYTQDDVEELRDLLRVAPYGQEIVLNNEVKFVFSDVGHILGSAAINLTIEEQGRDRVRITFSGDIGRYNDMILRAPQSFPQADYLIVESTYGNKLHDVLVSPVEEVLKQIEQTCIQKQGRLIIPAFSVGRTQELLYILNRLDLERRLPDLNYYVDSPLSHDATTIMKAHPECFNAQVEAVLRKDDDVFDFKGLSMIRDVEDSIRLGADGGPCVIISASGMAEAGRVKHHIAEAIEDPRNTIMMAGYCDRRSLGGQLKAGEKQVSIFGQHYEVKADIAAIDSLSAHGDYDDILHWLGCQDAEQIKAVYLVHGEYEVQNDFRERLLRKNFATVLIPDMHERFELS
jgi:metallo-beta-lactamase family protein